jgi:hypothetical protein
MDRPATAEPPRLSQRLARGLTIALLVAVIGFDVWTVRSGRKIWNFGEPQTDYYNLLVDGFLDGQLSLKAEVPQALLDSADPYDPAKRPPGLAKHDASLYHGKYYLYFGAVPAVTLLLPFKVLTGWAMPLQLAIIIFVGAGFLVSVGLWWQVRRTYFATVSVWLDPAVVLALGVASLGPVLLRRANVWETPISSGYFFAMLASFCLFRCLHSERRAAAWLAGAGLGFGLAVGSRPTYFFATSALAVPLLWWWWRGRQAKFWRWVPDGGWWGRVAAGVLPLAAIGVALAWYNYARFGNVFEFGVSYELSGVYEGKVKHFSASYAALNFHRYFWAPPHWSGTFPFIVPEPVTAAPEGYFIGDDLFGLWRNLPLTWLAPVALALLWRRRKTGGDQLGVWAAAGVAMFAGVAGFIVFFYSAMGRYLVDFAPGLGLLGCVGWAAAEEAAGRGKSVAIRWLVHAVGGAAVAYSVFFGLMYSFELNGEFRGRNPRAFQAVARWFNHAPYWAGLWRGTRYGPMELDVRLAPDAPGTERPLVTTGTAPWQDRVFLRRVDAARVQIGFAHGEHDVQLSRPLIEDDAVPHRVRVEMGSLLPPEEYPAAAQWDDLAGLRPTRRLRVEWDGEPVIAGRQAFFPTEPGAATVGAGATVVARSTLSDTAAAATGECDWRLRLRFPAEPGEVEPLVRLETGDRVEVISVARAERGDGVQFLCGRLGDAAVASEPLAFDRTAVHEVQFQLAGAAPHRRLTVAVDGQVVWAPVVAWGDPRNAGASDGREATAAGYAGQIFSREQFFDGADPLRKAYGPVKLRVEFPPVRGPAREPLVVTGVEGRGDLLSVEYLDARHLQLVYDHWGAAPVKSEPLMVDYAVAHEFEVTTGGLLAGLDAMPTAAAALRRVRVTMDGRPVLDRPADFNFAEPEEVDFGANRIGGTSCAPRFTGSILMVERAGVGETGARK